MSVFRELQEYSRESLWQCRICGMTFRAKVPDRCPACGHGDKEYPLYYWRLVALGCSPRWLRWIRTNRSDTWQEAWNLCDDGDLMMAALVLLGRRPNLNVFRRVDRARDDASERVANRVREMFPTAPELPRAPYETERLD